MRKRSGKAWVDLALPQFGIAHLDSVALEFAIILRHGEQNLGKGRGLRAFQVAEALLLRPHRPPRP